MKEDAVSTLSVYSNSKQSINRTIKQRSASVEVDQMNYSGKRTLIDSIKMRDYESIIKRVIDTPLVKDLDKKVPELDTNQPVLILEDLGD